jgi:hypothetical protein
MSKKDDKLNLNPDNLVHHCSICVVSPESKYFKGYNYAYEYFSISQNASDYSWSNHEPSLGGRSRNNEHELTCEPVGRDRLGNSTLNVMNEITT